MRNRLRFAVIAALVGTATMPRADTVRATSTSMMVSGPDYRDGAVQTVVPVYQMLDLSATDVQTPYTDNLELTLSTWGAADLDSARFGTGVWQNGAMIDSRLTGDINLMFLRADFLDRTVSLRIGRQIVADGTARMIHLDGANLQLALPGGFGLSGYAGTPVQPRFEARGGPMTVGNTEATFASGGRASWRYPGLLEVGASVAFATDHGDPSRQEVGADFRLTPHEMISLVGSGWWSLYEDRMGEGSIAAVLTPVRHLEVSLDYRHVEPDLFLPRNSILSVFAADKRDDVGGSVHWAVQKDLALDVDYHALFEPAGDGNWARAKGTYHPGGPSNTLGAEASWLDEPDNGYVLTRLFGATTLAALTGTLDLYGYFFRNAINGQDRALTATATIGYEIMHGWRALIAGTAGTTAYLSSQFDLMVKLVYDQTYSLREVR